MKVNFTELVGLFLFVCYYGCCVASNKIETESCCWCLASFPFLKIKILAGSGLPVYLVSFVCIFGTFSFYLVPMSSMYDQFAMIDLTHTHSRSLPYIA